MSAFKKLVLGNLNASDPNLNGMTPLPIFGYTPADLQNMGMTRFLLRADPNLNTPPCRPALSASSVLKSPRPRSKISRLPKDIQTNLNAMLARGCRYMEIIRYLNAQSYPGFNKVNLHDWKRTGFQQWLRTENPEAKA